VRAAQDLLFGYQHVIEELRLVTGHKGVFDVVVGDELLFSKHAEGRHAQPGEVLERFRTKLGPGVREYGT
jgi:predicted Rdx family selenoprotein